MARELGISRVTDITRLDRIGVPVYASIRPNARPGSLCVNAGKGVHPLEAQVGAYMEAIEFALAEYRRSPVQAVMATAKDVLDGPQRAEAILDFCPLVGVEIDLDAPLPCVEAEEVLSGTRCLIPAELVFHPLEPELGGLRYFGSSSNGLCSGNTVLEATVHGVAELLERDIRSHQWIKDNSVSVREDSLPETAQALVMAVRRADMVSFLRYTENEFGLPYFTAIVAERDATDPAYVSGGYGCHPNREVALTRAICEALQSRLSFIHGARDDLIDHHRRFAGADPAQRAGIARTLVQQLAASPSWIDYHQIPDLAAEISTLEDLMAMLVAAMRSAEIDKLCRVVYTRPHDLLQVVRVVVPRLEFFTEAAPRLGFRLREHVRRC